MNLRKKKNCRKKSRKDRNIGKKEKKIENELKW